MARTKVLPSGIRYSGTLATPIYLPSQLEDADIDTLLGMELDFRFSLLLDVYGIDQDDPNAWQKLAMRLATDHVPGLRRASLTNPPGRKSKWLTLGPLLLSQVANLRSTRKIGIKEAVRELRDDQKSAFYKMDVASLVARHGEARSAAAKRARIGRMPAGSMSFIDLVLSAPRKLKKSDLKRQFGSISFGVFQRWLKQKK